MSYMHIGVLCLVTGVVGEGSCTCGRHDLGCSCKRL